MTDSSNCPDYLDALAAAPEHHTLVFENDRVRVLETRIDPGETTPIHSHRWPSVLHVLSSSEFVRRADTGEIMLDSRLEPALRPGTVWSAPFPPHSLENVGTTPIHVLAIEIKGTER